MSGALDRDEGERDEDRDDGRSEDRRMIAETTP